MATSTLRFAIIVALIVGGVVLIGQAFPEGSTSALPGGSGTSPTPTQSASPTGGGNNGGGQPESPTPPVKGVKVAVYNGTFEAGLAATTADRLERLGYKINPDTSILDAPSKPVSQTTVYYVTAADKPAAEALASDFFKKIHPQVAKLPSNTTVPPGVQVAVYVGTDYTAKP